MFRQVTFADGTEHKVNAPIRGWSLRNLSRARAEQAGTTPTPDPDPTEPEATLRRRPNLRFRPGETAEKFLKIL